MPSWRNPPYKSNNVWGNSANHSATLTPTNFLNKLGNRRSCEEPKRTEGCCLVTVIGQKKSIWLPMSSSTSKDNDFTVYFSYFKRKKRVGKNKCLTSKYKFRSSKTLFSFFKKFFNYECVTCFFFFFLKSTCLDLLLYKRFQSTLFNQRKAICPPWLKLKKIQGTWFSSDQSTKNKHDPGSSPLTCSSIQDLTMWYTHYFNMVRKYPKTTKRNWSTTWSETKVSSKIPQMT